MTHLDSVIFQPSKLNRLHITAYKIGASTTVLYSFLPNQPISPALTRDLRTKIGWSIPNTNEKLRITGGPWIPTLTVHATLYTGALLRQVCGKN